MPAAYSQEPALLRAIDASDLTNLHRWHNDPQLYKSLGSSFRYVSLAAEEKWLQARLAYTVSEVYLAVCDRMTGAMVGYTSLRAIEWLSRHAEFHLVIGDVASRGKGYGASAARQMMAHSFGDLGLHRLWLEVLASNTAAIATYQKCGFNEEGRLSQHVFKDGSHVDVLIMGILAPK